MEIKIIQPHIPHYRIPFFNRLAKKSDSKVTILHSGEKVSGKNGKGQGIIFDQQIIDRVSAGCMEVQKGVRKYIKKGDIVVSRFNVRSVSDLSFTLGETEGHLVYWGHGFGQSRIANEVRYWMALQAESIILYNKSAYKRYIKKGVKKDKIFVAPNTIYVSNSKYDKSKKRNAFLFVGRLQKRKGVDKLISAFAKVSDFLPRDVTIEIVGDGSIRNELEGLARELGIRPRVKFQGRITSDAKLREIFQRALAYVSPDHVGLGVLHSFSYGIPVITRHNDNHAPEVTNIKNGRNGIIYNGGKHNLGEIIKFLSHNRLVSYQLGRNAYDHYSNRRRICHMVDGFMNALSFVSGKNRI